MEKKKKNLFGSDNQEIKDHLTGISEAATKGDKPEDSYRQRDLARRMAENKKRQEEANNPSPKSADPKRSTLEDIKSGIGSLFGGKTAAAIATEQLKKRKRD
jgi:hypothetical protein